MDKISVESIEGLFDAMDVIAPYLPDFIHIEDTKRLLAVLCCLCILMVPLNILCNLKVSKMMWAVVKNFFSSAQKEAFSEPTYKGWYTRLPSRLQKIVFGIMTVDAALCAVLFYFYTFFFIYPAFVVPYSNVRYGIVSYVIVIACGIFCGFVGTLSIGSTRQYYRLVKMVPN